MRTLVLLLLLALLPLRMWAAEGMALGMAIGQASEATSASASAMQAMPDDCPMRAQAMQGAGDEPAPAAGHCMACHLCAAFACLPQLAAVAGHAAMAAPRSAAAAFFDAELAPDLRPPIA